jgi:hypothetical protein
MNERFSDPVAFGRSIGLHLEPITRFPAGRLRGLALARNNGRVARECEAPLPRSNPYRKGSRRYAAFLEGYEWASVRAPQALASTEVAQ